MKNILIGGAWPYANGSLHIGHIAALLPGDILARYYRAKGNSVFYVSGSDCHGTPVTIRARQEKTSPREISDHYHDEFTQVFQKLGFSYDLYTKTSDERHISFVREFHKKLYESDLIYEKTIPQAFCPHCQKVLTDRLVTGICPICGEKTRGDQCDACGAVLEAENVKAPCCAECGSNLNFSDSTQLFIALTKLKTELSAFLNAHPNWRINAAAFTKRYLDDGLRDRAITRDLDWGIDVPKSGYESKKIYIWAENVLGYLSASNVLAQQRGIPFKEIWGENARHYYIHGKDNIPFHTVILPALLLANGGNWRLPDDIISSEYLTLEGRKISTSQNYAIWMKDVVDHFHPDALRYFLIANGPEKRDTDFTWKEFADKNNSDLVGCYGNFVNRTLAFIVKYCSSIVPIGEPDNSVSKRLDMAYPLVGSQIEEGRLKDALETILELVRFGNKFYDSNEPWKTRKSDPEKCFRTLYNCVWLLANLAVLLKPFLPFSSKQVMEWLGLTDIWERHDIYKNIVLHEISILFQRLDCNQIEKEIKKYSDCLD